MPTRRSVSRQMRILANDAKAKPTGRRAVRRFAKNSSFLSVSKEIGSPLEEERSNFRIILSEIRKMKTIRTGKLHFQKALKIKKMLENSLNHEVQMPPEEFTEFVTWLKANRPTSPDQTSPLSRRMQSGDF